MKRPNAGRSLYAFFMLWEADPSRNFIPDAASDPRFGARVDTVAGAAGREFVRSVLMPDFLMILSGVGFFVVAILYSFACDRM